MTRYRTKDGDILDAICWKYYGRVDGVLEAVLEANPGLSEQPAVLPAGFVITLPDLSKPTRIIETVKLWN
jgi:phage tail protein X